MQIQKEKTNEKANAQTQIENPTKKANEKAKAPKTAK